GVALEVRVGDLLEGLEGHWQAIAFNPPFSAGADSALVARAKQIVRRLGPFERRLMRRPPRAVLAFRRDLVRRFVLQALEHLEHDGALHLLLYAQELEALASISPELAVSAEATDALRRRNLRLVRLSAGSGGRTDRAAR
ncbi:MAG TPA: hypothetical protein VI942_08000, partial [Thermoanaerobaculia bacterium]|nr:hypothetical protein [Thermoanaerobaculia bacterium]